MATNMMLVERAANANRSFGNDIATPSEAREMLSMPPLDHAAVNKAPRRGHHRATRSRKASIADLSKVFLPIQSGMGGKEVRYAIYKFRRALWPGGIYCRGPLLFGADEQRVVALPFFNSG